MGTNFSKAFDISFNDVNNEQAYAFTTSWGLSTRMIGAIIMAHGDDKGLIMPPKIAPHQVVIVPIYRKDDQLAKDRVMAAVDELAGQLRGHAVRVKVDSREGMSPGWKFNEWEQKGVPLRLELGPKDLEAGEVVIANRLKENKETVKLAEASSVVVSALKQFHDDLYERARVFRDERSFIVADYESFKEKVAQGWVYINHCGKPACEEAIQEETKATPRCIPFVGPEADGPCVRCGEASAYPRKVIFAKAY
jgi:prolyl-tRNA synthetase